MQIDIAVPGDSGEGRLLRGEGGGADDTALFWGLIVVVVILLKAGLKYNNISDLFSG